MQRKAAAWKPKGMNRDLSVSAFSSEFVFENRNLRLSTNESNTLMSWVNERSTAEISVSINTKPWLPISEQNPVETSLRGIPIGTAVINHKLVVFTTWGDGESGSESLGDFEEKDFIYVLWYNADETSMNGKRLYCGNLNFNTAYPLETLISYENLNIQKIYWTDGLNQPRVINIEAEDEIVENWNTAHKSIDTFFDFLPPLLVPADCSVTRNEYGGFFDVGTIQYSITYSNKNGQESNVVWTSPLMYCSHEDRGASAEETKVNCSFNIHLENLDSSYQYVRLYSFQRTSLDDNGFAKLLRTIKISEVPFEGITIVDTGTIGSTIDPELLLLIGGHEITALTMAEKDNTLFLGNIKQAALSTVPLQHYFRNNAATVTFAQDEDAGSDSEEEDVSQIKTIKLAHVSSTEFYGYTHLLQKSNKDITTFKGGENYRFGFQLMSRTGEWSEPVWLGKDVINELYPNTSIYSDVIHLTYAYLNLSLQDIRTALPEYNLDYYTAIRPLVVFPDISSQKVLMQGVLCPTIFNVRDRLNIPYAQASWFFRPIIQKQGTSYDPYTRPQTDYDGQINVDSLGQEIEFGHFESLYKDSSEEAFSYWRRQRTVGGDAPLYSIEYFSEVETVSNEKQLKPLSLSAGITYTIQISYLARDHRHYFPHDGHYKLRLIDANDDVETFEDIGDMQWEFDKNITTKYYEHNNTANHPINGQPAGPTTALVSRKAEYTPKYPLSFKFTPTRDTVKILLQYMDGNNGDNIVGSNGYGILYKILAGGSTTGTEVEATEYVYKKYSEMVGDTNCGGVFQDLKTGSDALASTQFFVDQSIVTLNSPDLDYNPSLQRLSAQCKLRVVGVIPITGLSSAFDIQATASDTYTPVGEDDPVTPARALDFPVRHLNISIFGGNRLCSDYLWEDICYKTNQSKSRYTATYKIYPWHRTGTLLNKLDSEYSALKTKKESNLLFSLQSVYLDNASFVEFENISTKYHLAENDYVEDLRLEKQRFDLDVIHYYPNIDTSVTNIDTNNHVVFYTEEPNPAVGEVVPVIPIKYKSNTHVAISLQALDSTSSDADIPILPCAKNDYLDNDSTHAFGKYDKESFNPYPDDELHHEEHEDFSYAPYWRRNSNDWNFSQSTIDVKDIFGDFAHSFLWVGELHKDVINPFGGTTNDALRENIWLVGGDTVYFDSSTDNVTLLWTHGDTYYQRYDCLKTYQYTPDDVNQNTEILSFMCENRVNIDGRYDANRGMERNYNYTPVNFGLWNSAYAQQDNYFSYKIAQTDSITTNSYSNWLTWSMTKTPGADTDEYTHVTLASPLSLDGDKGEISSLRRFNDQIIAFQEKGISQILYNESVQIASTSGVPIEIANSGKVQGARYISNTVGCSNKWSIAESPAGLYFMDSEGKNLWMFNGQLANLSQSKGFNSWFKARIPKGEITWNPLDFDNFVSYYDYLNQEMHFINKEESLVFSERVGEFTSFYDYGNTPYFCNLDSTGIWIRQDATIWKHQGGNTYGKFFGKNKDYSTTIVANPDAVMDKLFTNMEFRASMQNEGTVNNSIYTPFTPFDSIEAWNEYQHGKNGIVLKNGVPAMQHYEGSNNPLKRKFRIWRCDIPRDNYPVPDTKEGVSRFSAHPMDRMRNPWLYLKLQKEAAESGNLPKMELHDLLMYYYLT